MKFLFGLLMTIPSMTFAQHGTVIGKHEMNTYVHHLSSKTVKCNQGSSHGYQTYSYLVLHHIVLNTPTSGKQVKEYVASSDSLGEPCEKMLQEFGSLTNQFGTIQTVVTSTFSKWTKNDDIVIRDERGDNTSKKIYSQFDVLQEDITFKVGKFNFRGSALFHVLKPR